MSQYKGKELGVRTAIGLRVGVDIPELKGAQKRTDRSTVDRGAFQNLINIRHEHGIIVERGGQSKEITTPISYAWDSLYDAGGGGIEAGLSLYFTGPEELPVSTAYSLPVTDASDDYYYVVGYSQTTATLGTFRLYKIPKQFSREVNLLHGFDSTNASFNIVGMTTLVSNVITMPVGILQAEWTVTAKSVNTDTTGNDHAFQVLYGDDGTVHVFAGEVVNNSDVTHGFIWEVSPAGTVTTRVDQTGGYLTATRGFVVGSDHVTIVNGFGVGSKSIIKLTTGATVGTATAVVPYTSHYEGFTLGGSDVFLPATNSVTAGVQKLTTAYVASYNIAAAAASNVAYTPISLHKIGSTLYLIAWYDNTGESIATAMRVYTSANGSSWSAPSSISAGDFDLGFVQFAAIAASDTRLYVQENSVYDYTVYRSGAANLTAGFTSYAAPGNDPDVAFLELTV